MAVLQSETQGAMQRRELLAAAAEFGAIVVLFLIAFFGRDFYGDTGRSLLIVLSSAAGGAAVAGGLLSLYRAMKFVPSRLTRVILGTLQIFVGAYTIVHVLS